MNSETRIFFLLNPLSGDGIAARKWPEIEAELIRMKLSYSLETSSGDLRDIAYEISIREKGNGTIVAGIGGDGTHCAIINGLMKFASENPGCPPPRYAPVPLGTANNIAKSFNLLPRGGLSGPSLTRLLRGIVHGADLGLDVGKTGDQFFIDDFSAGFDAEILSGRDKDKKQLSSRPVLRKFIRGYVLYLANALRSLGSFRPLEAEVEADGRKVYSGEIFNIVVNNTRIYAGEFDFTDSALPDDGLMDMLVFTGRKDYLARYLLGNRLMPQGIRRMAHRNRKHLQHLKAKSFRMKFARPLAYQADGEMIGVSDSIQIQVIPAAIRLKIPVEPL